jgi:hypothetical protein
VTIFHLCSTAIPFDTPENLNGFFFAPEIQSEAEQRVRYPAIYAKRWVCSYWVCICMICVTNEATGKKLRREQYVIRRSFIHIMSLFFSSYRSCVCACVHARTPANTHTYIRIRYLIMTLHTGYVRAVVRRPSSIYIRTHVRSSSVSPDEVVLLALVELAGARVDVLLELGLARLEVAGAVAVVAAGT